MIINMLDVQQGYDAWAAKPHNAKWVRKIDGTPIANDIVATIWNTLRDIIEERKTPSPQSNVTPEMIERGYAAARVRDIRDERTHRERFEAGLRAALATTEGQP